MTFFPVGYEGLDIDALVALLAKYSISTRNDWNAHRPVREDEDLDLIFTFREKRKVSNSLTLQYDKTIYLIADTKEHRNLIGKYIDVYEYPDGRIELRATPTTALPYATYDRLPEVNQGAIVENKRLSHALQIAQHMQEQRNSRRGLSVPARTNQGLALVILEPLPGTKPQRKIGVEDLEAAIVQSARRRGRPPKNAHATPACISRAGHEWHVIRQRTDSCQLESHLLLVTP